jgi:hypothetical protein
MQNISALNIEHILLAVEDIKNVEKLLELSVLLKTKKSANPISILSVVSNNAEAEKNILKARTKLEEFINQAAATETQVNLITTIDHNIASGISRVSKEIMANIIILGWPQRSDIFEKLIGEKVDTILNNTDKTTFLCDFEKPLVLNKKIVVAVPPLAEREQGFEHWLSKIATIAQELSIPIEFHCNSNTKHAIDKVSKLVKFSAEIITINFDDWEDFIIVARYIHEDDLFVLVSARKGSVSYMNLLDGLPVKLGKYFTANSKIIIYPQQNINEYIDDNYDEFSTEPLTRGIEAVQKIGKGIASIFKKDNNG